MRLLGPRLLVVLVEVAYLCYFKDGHHFDQVSASKIRVLRLLELLTRCSGKARLIFVKVENALVTRPVQHVYTATSTRLDVYVAGNSYELRNGTRPASKQFVSKY